MNLDKALADGRKIIFVDEVVFTRNSCLKLAFSRKHENVTIKMTGSHSGYMSAIAGISYEEGIEMVHIAEGAVKRWDFMIYLKELVR